MFPRFVLSCPKTEYDVLYFAPSNGLYLISAICKKGTQNPAVVTPCRFDSGSRTTEYKALKQLRAFSFFSKAFTYNLSQTCQGVLFCHRKGLRIALLIT